MDIKLWNELILAIGPSKLKPWGIDPPEEKRWNKYQEVDLARYTPKSIEALIALVGPHTANGVKGAKTVVSDCKVWISALKGGSPKARETKSFASLVWAACHAAARRNEAEGRPFGPRVYQRDDERGVFLGYYIEDVEWKSGQRECPPHAVVSLVWQEFGGRSEYNETFWMEDVAGKTVEQAFIDRGYVFESAEIRADYEARKALFVEWADKIGMQFWARGKATAVCNGNPQGRDSSWYYRRTHVIDLEKGGTPSRVVVDLFYESDKEDRDRQVHVNKLRWHRHRPRQEGEDEDEGIADPELIDEPEIPLHPMLACFDMRRHQRLRVDVGQLEPYVYDPSIGDKLVLPKDPRSLVDMLLSQKGTFTDIVRVKSGGAIILCAGPPGTGKTLTAEVYAEVEKRPLFSVQCSQLGTNPSDLEDELLKNFARATRWNAIMLLDEADVYVHTRGNDLEQNAIVGVFLRVLEYYNGVLFMTTNRSDLVDDAVLSRCIARIDYKVPTADDQRKIWKVLSQTSGIIIPDNVIEEVIAAYGEELTGRDVKNLLKLAKLVSDSRHIPIDLNVIKFVKRFKPTGVTVEEEVELPMGEVTIPIKRVVRRPV